MTPLVFMVLFIREALGQDWKFTYRPTYICALEGSSVNMSCNYTYPSYAKVTEAFWINQDSVDISKDKSFTLRIRVNCGDKRSQCSLHMSELTKTDARYQFYCRIITDYVTEKRTGTPGIVLSVTGLQIVSSGKGAEVKEGDHVTLICNTTCNLTRRHPFIWSKDGHPVEKQIIYNQLQLHPVNREDEGNYSCAVRGFEGRPSPPMRIKVMCPMVLSSDTEDVKEGDKVTLTCNTTCNLTNSPSFVWSKDGHPVERKQIIKNQLKLHPVSYGDEGNYTCAVKDYEGLPSPPYRLQVIQVGHSPVELRVVIAALVGGSVCGVVGLLCVVWLRSHKRNSNGTQEGDKEDQDDVQYSAINFLMSDQRRAAGPPSAERLRAEDDVQYATCTPQ